MHVNCLALSVAGIRHSVSANEPVTKHSTRADEM